MSFKHKTISISLFLITFTLGAERNLKYQSPLDTVLRFVGESTPLHMCNKYIQTHVSGLYKGIWILDDEPASEEYQKLGKEAQKAVKIPDNWHLPIKKLNPKSPLASTVGALTEPDAIYVNEERLAQRSYGAQRSALFHEAIHEKYHDLAFDSILELGSLISASVISHVLIKNLSPFNKSGVLRKGGAFALGYITSCLISSKFNYYREQRADTEGHYATACYKCVEESAAFARYRDEIEKNPLIHNGYLGPNDLEIIAQDLREENKLCQYHKNLS